MQQSLGNFWQSSYHQWTPQSNQGLDEQSMLSLIYQNSLKSNTAKKDSAIGAAEYCAWNYIQKDRINRYFEATHTSIGKFKESSENTIYYTDKYGYRQYEYIENANCSEWFEENKKDLGKGHLVSDVTVKVNTSVSINPDGFIEIEVKKHYFENTNINVYESGEDNFHLNPLSAYVGEKLSFTENGDNKERSTIQDMQELNLKHKNDKWYDYGKVAVNFGFDTITMCTFGVSAAASTSAKGIATAFIKAVVPTTAKDAIQFTIVQGGQMTGDYLIYKSKPQDDIFETLTGLLPGFGTYYAAVDASSKDPIKGFYKPIK